MRNGINMGIVVCLPRSRSWPEWLQYFAQAQAQGAVLNYGLPQLPLGVKPGHRCWLVYRNQIRGWQEIQSLQKNLEFVDAATGTKVKGHFVLRHAKFHPAASEIEIRDFDGFRYLMLLLDRAKIGKLTGTPIH